MNVPGLPPKQGLYDPQHEKDSCGVGFVVDIKGQRSHQIVQQGLQVLESLTHRGAQGCDPCTGDGAGILLQVPHEFFKRAAKDSGIKLPGAGEYGVGMVFLPPDADARAQCETVFTRVIKEAGAKLLGWRDVPVKSDAIGALARTTEPFMRQVFIARGIFTDEEFERRLYVIRKCAERAVRESAIEGRDYFYIPSLSSSTIVFKGLLLPHQIPQYYQDLTDSSLTSAMALVHSRFSTNTFPTWPLAHPYRYICHNGEINTLKGNVNWMRARQGRLNSELFGKI
jgi:glutamate synthase (NADPH/NADH) large chain/glutamate synthase (ferredoxin)